MDRLDQRWITLQKDLKEEEIKSLYSFLALPKAHAGKHALNPIELMIMNTLLKKN